MAIFEDYQTKDQYPYSELTYNYNNPGLSGKYWTSYPYDGNESYFLGFLPVGPEAGSLHEGRTVSNKVRAIRWF